MSEEQKGIHCYIGARGYGRTVAEENFRLKSVLKEIRELLGHFECGQLCECTQELAIHVLEIIDKGIGK